MFNLIKRLFSRKPMGNIDMKPLAGRPSDEIVEALQAYKKKNPVKYEMKKEALFKRYGLNVVEDEAKIEEVKDASDVELEAIKKKVTKK